MTLLGFLQVLRKRWIVVVAGTVLGVLAALAVSAVLTEEYEAEAKTFVAVTSSEDPTAVYQSSQFAVQRVKSYTLLIDSPEVLERVIDDLDLDTTTRALGEQVSIENPPDTTFLTVRVRDTEPERAAEIANRVSVELAALIETLETSPTGEVSSVKASLTTPATTPTNPVSPRLAINAALGLLLGLAVGVSVAIAREHLDTTLRDQDAVVALTGRLPLASVPVDPAARRRAPLALDAASPLLESFRTLRTNLRFADVDDPPHVMVVCSALSSEGKSTTAQNLAIALARSGLAVCLLDADLRRPSLAENLGIEGAVGLTDVLVGEVGLDDALTGWREGLLHVLPAGTIPSDPPTLLGSHHMRSLLVDLRRRFDYVIIDAPPIVHVSDAVVLADAADGALLVIRAGRSRRDQVQSSLDVLRSAGVRLVGTVLTFAASPGRYEYAATTDPEPLRVPAPSNPAPSTLRPAAEPDPKPAPEPEPEPEPELELEPKPVAGGASTPQPRRPATAKKKPAPQPKQRGRPRPRTAGPSTPSEPDDVRGQ